MQVAALLEHMLYISPFASPSFGISCRLISSGVYKDLATGIEM